MDNINLMWKYHVPHPHNTNATRTISWKFCIRCLNRAFKWCLLVALSHTNSQSHTRIRTENSHTLIENVKKKVKKEKQKCVNHPDVSSLRYMFFFPPLIHFFSNLRIFRLINYKRNRNSQWLSIWPTWVFAMC